MPVPCSLRAVTLAVLVIAHPLAAQDMPFDRSPAEGLAGDPVLVDALYDVITRLTASCAAGQDQGCTDQQSALTWLSLLHGLALVCAGGDPAACDDYRTARATMLNLQVQYLTGTMADDLPLATIIPAASGVTIAQLGALSQIYDGQFPSYMDCYDPSPECDDSHGKFLEQLRE